MSRQRAITEALGADRAAIRRRAWFFGERAVGRGGGHQCRRDGSVSQWHGRALPRTAVVLSLGACLCSAAAHANAASTDATPMASSDAWLSNLDESDDAGIAVGKPAGSLNDRFTQAIRFQTGSNERGYNLTSVKAVLANAAASDGVRVRIFGARSIGTPYLSFYTLTNPVIADGTLTFTAPASATLRKDAGYFVVFDSTASDAGNDYEIRGTESDSLNSMAAGWSLNAVRHSRNKDSASWTTASAVPLIEINGDAVVQATDANLIALRMRDGNGKLVTYSPTFDSAITSYGTTASPKVDRITIQATASNADGAEVSYLDGDDQLLTDADSVKDGFQVDLEAGPNTIKVRVMAEDGSTTRTYTMVVTREPSRVSADALASNLDEHFSKRLFIGNLEPGKVLRNQALGFETGGNEAGYVLTSVKIYIWEITHSAGVRVRIFSSTAEGNPDTSLYTLSGSVVLPTDRDAPPEDSPITTLEAPANATLEPNTKYFVVLDSRASELYRFYKVFGTKSDAISKVADGWSLNNFRHTGIRDTGVWETADEVPFVEVTGSAVVPSSDATLSGLGLTWDDGGTETDIALDPPFDASTTSYTAGVGGAVDQITINATKGDAGATVLYFDGADSELSDADTNATGFQVGLGVGANTIKAKVAASDGETTQAYTVVVTRAPADTRAPTVVSASVDGATLVIAFNEALAAANLDNGAFAVKKTPLAGPEAPVTLSGSPSISGATVTLTLAAAVVSTDTVTVTYTKPATGTNNTLKDAADNEVGSFSDEAVTNNTDAATDPITVGYDATSYEVAEDAGSVALTVRVASHPVGGAPRAFTLNANTTDGTADGGDYGGVAAESIPFGVGDTFKTQTITVLDDTVAENDENFQSTLALVSGSGVSVSPATATVTILANDPDTTAPTATGATVAETSLTVTFDETLAAAPNLANDAFAVNKTPSGESETTVPLTGSPSVSDDTVTLTLATRAATTDTDVKVSYTKPTSGTANMLKDANGNEVEGFADLAVANHTITDPSNDATLRGLVLEDADSNAIGLSPAFASSTTSYTATVAYAVAEITIAPETNDDNATFALLDGHDSALDDADVTADGIQIGLDEGANTIKVKVTAEDGTTTTYTVVATRRVAVVTTLVSNAGQPLCTDPPDRWSQPFTTGGNAAGYTVTAVNVAISSVASTYLVRLVPSSSDGRPDERDPSRFVTLTNPARVARGEFNPFTAPSGTTLAASTTYHVMVTDTAGTGSAGRIKVTASPAEQGDADWVVGDTSYHKTAAATSWAESTTFFLWMAVQGHANRSLDDAAGGSTSTVTDHDSTATASISTQRPSAPRGLRATPGDTQATFAWTAPLCDGSAAITRYEYSIDNGATWTDNSLDTQVTLTGLTNGIPITFRGRAVNAVGEGPETRVTTTPVGGTDDGSGGEGRGDGGGGDGGVPPPPVAVREIGPHTVAVGAVLEVDIAHSFSQHDLEYTVESADPLTAAVEVTQQAVISITGHARGATAITVTATDHRERTAAQTFVVTVIGPWHVPLFPPAADLHGREGFARIVNLADRAGEVAIEAIDDTGVSAGTLKLAIEANSVAHFNSTDLEIGAPDKGLPNGVGSGQGQWRLVVTSDLAINVLAYMRTSDGLVTPMHDAVPAVGETHRVAIFNPASNHNQLSRLRVVNPGDEHAEVTVTGTDDAGVTPDTAASLTVPPGASVELSADELEAALGDGFGKWRLQAHSTEAVIVMSLLASPTGHLTNLSTVPAVPDREGMHVVPLFPAASDAHGRQGFLRVVNRSTHAGEVTIAAFDDSDVDYESVTLALGAGETVHFNSDDLELGNAHKGLAGSTGSGTGDWHLELASDLDLVVLTYVRTPDGFLTAMHDLAPRLDGEYWIATFNPGSNTNQLSALRLVNVGSEDAGVTITGVDDAGISPGSAVVVTVPARASRTILAADLESGGEGLTGALGDGAGKWRLRVDADGTVIAMNLMMNPTGHLTNLSGAPQ